MKSIIFISFLFSALLLCSCATSPTGRKQFMIVSPETAIKSSQQAYFQTIKPLAKKGKILHDKKINNRIRYITGRLIAQATRLFPKSRSWKWSVAIIDEPEQVNAWCMAGGKMAIYTGMLYKIQPTDDELAQVMGHEIAHALSNHTAEKMSVAMASQLGILGVAIATQDSSSQGALVTGSAAAAALAVSMPNSRKAEKEADILGLELAARAGYNPHAAASLWQKMGNLNTARPPEFLSTHPSPGNRKQTLSQLANKMMPYYLDRSKRPVYPLPERPVY